MWETWIRSLGWEDSLEKGKATRLPTPVFWPGEFHGLYMYSPWGRRVWHDWVTFTSLHLSSNLLVIILVYFLLHLPCSSDLFGSSLYFLTLVKFCVYPCIFMIIILNSVLGRMLIYTLFSSFSEVWSYSLVQWWGWVPTELSSWLGPEGHIWGWCQVPSTIRLESLSCVWLCDLMDCSLPGSSVHRILQARILECVAISFSRGSSWLRVWTWVSCIASRLFTIWAAREAYSEVVLCSACVHMVRTSSLKRQQGCSYWPPCLSRGSQRLVSSSDPGSFQTSGTWSVWGFCTCHLRVKKALLLSLMQTLLVFKIRCYRGSYFRCRTHRPGRPIWDWTPCSLERTSVIVIFLLFVSCRSKGVGPDSTVFLPLLLVSWQFLLSVFSCRNSFLLVFMSLS